MSLTDLSLIMMTGNRPQMFADVIDLYSETAPELRIFVGDFGGESAQEQNRAVADRHPSNVHYFPFTPETPWIERYTFLLGRCGTPFVAMAADDDFNLPDGLRESVDFLKAHSDYSACHGLYYQVRQASQPGTLEVGIDNGWTGRAYESRDPAGRLLALMYWYQAVFYAVQRRDDMLRALPPAVIEKPASVMVELYTACATVILGKVARLRSPYCIRNRAPEQYARRFVTFMEVVLLGGTAFLDIYGPVRAGLVGLLESYGTERDWGRMVDVAYACHIRAWWRDHEAFSILAAQGELPPEDVAQLATRQIEAEKFTIPGEYLSRFIQPLAVHGWPSNHLV